MKLTRRSGILLALLIVVGILAGLAVHQASADCKGEQCINCVHFVCTNVPTPGYCDCTSWGDPPIGSFGCVAGGGACRITY